MTSSCSYDELNLVFFAIHFRIKHRKLSVTDHWKYYTLQMSNGDCCADTIRLCSSDGCFNYAEDIERETIAACGAHEYARDAEFDFCDGSGVRKKCIVRNLTIILPYKCPGSIARCPGVINAVSAKYSFPTQ